MSQQLDEIEDLIRRGIATDDDDEYWDILESLRGPGSDLVFRRAVELSRSSDPDARRLAAGILSQFGGRDRPRDLECTKTLIQMYEVETDRATTLHILGGLYFCRSSLVIPIALACSRHVDSEFRDAAVLILGMHQYDAELQMNREVIATLIKLTRDSDAAVRDWACFTFSCDKDLSFGIDSPEIHSALADRLSDADPIARGQAMKSLASFGDQRAIAALLLDLQAETVAATLVGAAADIGSPLLLPALVALRNRWHGDPAALEEAIASCSQTETG